MASSVTSRPARFASPSAAPHLVRVEDPADPLAEVLRRVEVPYVFILDRSFQMPLRFRITSQMEGNIIPSTKSSFR